MSRGLALLLDQAETTAQGHSIDVNDAEHVAVDFLIDRTDAYDAQTVGVLHIVLDALGGAEVHLDIQVRKADTVLLQCQTDDVECTRAELTDDNGQPLQFVECDGVCRHARIARSDDSHQFVVHEWRVLQLRLADDTLHHADVNLVRGQCCLHLATIAAEHGDADIGMLAVETGDDLRHDILRNGGAGTDAQLARGVLLQGVHVEVQLLVALQYARGMFQHQLSRLGQLYVTAQALKKPHVILLLQLLDMLADGGLTDKQFLGSLCEAQVSRHAVENLNSDVNHVVVSKLLLRRYLFSYTDDAAVFLLFLRTTDGLVGMEIPIDAKPEDATAVLAVVDEGIDRIV